MQIRHAKGEVSLRCRLGAVSFVRMLVCQHLPKDGSVFSDQEILLDMLTYVLVCTGSYQPSRTCRSRRSWITPGWRVIGWWSSSSHRFIYWAQRSSKSWEPLSNLAQKISNQLLLYLGRGWIPQQPVLCGWYNTKNHNILQLRGRGAWINIDDGGRKSWFELMRTKGSIWWSRPRWSRTSMQLGNPKAHLCKFAKNRLPEEWLTVHIDVSYYVMTVLDLYTSLWHVTYLTLFVYINCFDLPMTLTYSKMI